MGIARDIAESHARQERVEKGAVDAARDAELCALRERAELAERELTEQKSIMDKLALELVQVRQEREALKVHNEELAQKLELLQLKLTGRKNERFVDPAQTSLLEDPLPVPPPRLPGKEDEPEQTPEQEKAERKRRRIASGGPHRRNIADMNHLPTRTVRCPMDPAAVCKGCQGPLTVIGQAEAWRIEWVPGHHERVHVLHDKCACPSCPSQGILTVPDPFILPRAMCCNGLLAAVLVDKFADHIPLNRQAKRMERMGFEISTAVLASWVVAVAHPGKRLLSRIADAIQAELMEAANLLADDTGFPVQDGDDGALRKGRLWAFTDRRQVVFRFTPTKAGLEVARILSGFRGDVLLADAGSEFNEVVRARGLRRAGCWCHLRRYFFEARHHFPRESALALRTMRDLFLLERSLVSAPPEHILEVRQRDAKPLVEGFFAWVDQVSKTVRPKSSLGEAVGYARNNRETFLVFLDRPGIPMHNNLSELLLRGPVVGRKNWLFARTEGGAEAAAVMFTIIGSCMLQAIDPLVYLTDVLNRLPFHPANRVHELTPLNWRLAREAAAAKAASPAAA